MSALRVVEPPHVLTIAGSSTGKVGSCRCGAWSAVSGHEEQLSSDDITDAFIAHLRRAGAARPACGGCDVSVATARRGVVSRFCSGCVLDEESGRSDGHPGRREDPERSDAVAVLA